MTNYRDNNVYKYFLDEAETAREEIEAGIHRLENLATEVRKYDFRLEAILNSYVIPHLNGALGNSNGSMMNLKDVINDLTDHAMDLELEQHQEKHAEVVKETLQGKRSEDGYTFITKKTLLESPQTEGLVLIGCGGDLMDWFRGVNEIMFEEEVTDTENYFEVENMYVFQDGQLTNIFLPFEEYSGKELNMGRLAVVRIQYIDWMKWYSDYLVNSPEYTDEDSFTEVHNDY